ncbi:MAG: hypothetical protein K6F50_05540 [Kiritimatiellae bacterium]|nr:hypothetical protein [Kiritimatiellia bacterium]
MKAIRTFLSRVRKTGKRRPGTVKTVAMGREREFEAWDVGEDTYIFELGVRRHMDEHPSVLIVRKADLRRRAKGRVLTMTTGNHSVAAFPLLDGRFWKLSTVPSQKRGEVLMHSILCANVVQDKIEISQRDVPPKKLFATDEWLLSSAGFTLSDIVMGERSDAAIDYYRRLGQEWRVKQLAWRATDMRVALAASKKRIASKVVYYHSTRGVHFLSFAEFSRFADLAKEDAGEFTKALREMVSVYEGNVYSFTRQPKYRGHHEIELFGVQRGVAIDRIVPELEKLMESITLGRIDKPGVERRAEEIRSLYESLLARPELADEKSREFTEQLYMCITGEIYSVVGEGSTPAFDDRRTALPGATFVDGRPVFHSGSDERSEVLLSNIRGLMSKDEKVEYANVYELRGEDDEDIPLGKGRTREIVYKTNRSPVECSKIEKRLSSAKKGYSSYMLARIEAFKALGVSLSDYKVLRRRGQAGRRPFDFFIRDRLEGETMDSIPANYFCSADDAAFEEKGVVLALAQLMGDAAAQNMAMKKFDPETKTPLYGVGKEIYAFEYDIIAGRVVPKSVSTCSVRGSFGWPDLSFTDENLHSIASFYLSYFAHALKIYQKRHKVTMAEVAERFMEGFEYRTHAMEWQLSVMRDKFEEFNPDIPSGFAFMDKWHFALWSLERQERRLPILRRMFFQKVDIEEKNENIRNNPEPVRV